MILSELLKAIQPLKVVGDVDKEIQEVNIDSRKIEPGHLFMAMRGTQTDGHAYIPGAIEKGAVAVVYLRSNAASPRLKAVRSP